ncbi:hypothetical protein L1887_59226 [Cichorium endivia]|nr:hypothetical protein L1887_59226 [Cichorium endivia]
MMNHDRDADRAGLLGSDSDSHSQNAGSYSRPFRREPAPGLQHSNIVQPGRGTAANPTSTFHSTSTGSHSSNSGTPAFSAHTMLAHADRRVVRQVAPLLPAPPHWRTRSDDDDWLHDPSINDHRKLPKSDMHESITSMRGILNVGTLLLILGCLLMLFLGYPVIIEISKQHSDGTASSSLSTTNTYTTFPSEMKRGLIDQQTPQSAYKRTSAVDDSKWHLVFSDEFNTPGRSFWPGEDPFWEGFHGWYSGTNDYEYYTPEAINTTTDGKLQISFEERETNNLNFRSGMLQSWNKACFTGGYLEVRAQLPGSPDVAGFWPGLWLMGNLGRPGYNGVNEGIWPYSYAGCDTGALPNQTWVNGSGPAHAINANGQFSYQVNHKLSYLPGLRFPACTCPGEDHPGPNNNVARSSPELDMLEATIGANGGQSSQSLQVAPFDVDYFYNNKSGTDYTIHNTDTTKINGYHGNELQESVSAAVCDPGPGIPEVRQPAVRQLWRGVGAGHERRRHGVERRTGLHYLVDRRQADVDAEGKRADGRARAGHQPKAHPERTHVDHPQLGHGVQLPAARVGPAAVPWHAQDRLCAHVVSATVGQIGCRAIRRNSPHDPTLNVTRTSTPTSTSPGSPRIEFRRTHSHILDASSICTYIENNSTVRVECTGTPCFEMSEALFEFGGLDVRGG